MGYENNGGFEALVNEFEEGDNLFGVSAVKIPSRFVSQNNSRTADKAPCDGNTLLFAPESSLGKRLCLSAMPSVWMTS